MNGETKAPRPEAEGVVHDHATEIALVADAGEPTAEVRQFCADPADLLRALLLSPRVLRLYPPGHSRIEAHLDELAACCSRILDIRGTPLVFSVRGMRVETDGLPVTAPPEQVASFAMLLRRRRIQSLTLTPGITRGEIAELVRLFATDYRELLRTGGPGSVLEPEKHPNLALSVSASGVAGPGGDEARQQIPEALEECLTSAETTAALEELRARFARFEGEEEEFDHQLWRFLVRAEWAEMTADEVRAAFEGFLEVVDRFSPSEVEKPEGSVRDRVNSMKSFFMRLDPHSLARGEPVAPAIPVTPVSYALDHVRELMPELIDTGPGPHERLREQMAAHRHDENLLLILCELMVSAWDEDTYAQSREAFLRTLVDRATSSESISRILRYIAVDLPSVPFESRDNLVQAVFDSTADEEALVLFLCSMTEQPDVARPILRRLAARHEPFPLLVRLLRAPLLQPFRRVLTEQLLAAARAKREAFILWARRNRDMFFAPEVFEPLFSKGTELLGAVCKEMLLEGTPADRTLLLNRLEEAGSETALRLLVLGLPGSSEACDEALLHALAGFRHPLAVSVLREVIHRNNTRAFHRQEARTALAGLARLGLPEAIAFLEEVASARGGLLPLYRGPLRRLAMETLSGRVE